MWVLTLDILGRVINIYQVLKMFILCRMLSSKSAIKNDMCSNRALLARCRNKFAKKWSWNFLNSLVISTWWWTCGIGKIKQFGQDCLSLLSSRHIDSLWERKTYLLGANYLERNLRNYRAVPCLICIQPNPYAIRCLVSYDAMQSCVFNQLSEKSRIDKWHETFGSPY